LICGGNEEEIRIGVFITLLLSYYYIPDLINLILINIYQPIKGEGNSSKKTRGKGDESGESHKERS
jgi:hypothetical protein